jgi:hypothetical protein
MFPLITGDSVMKPQFVLKPFIPNASATRDGKHPKRNPYARPVSPETRPKKWGFSIFRAKSCAAKNTREATVRHQRREALSTLARKSDPTPVSISE